METPAHSSTSSHTEPWPELPVDAWSDTRDTLQLWLQIVGKIRLTHSPLLNHWWNVPLYVNGRGLTTSLMWTADGRGFEISLDFLRHQLNVQTVEGDTRTMVLEPRSVSSFYSELLSTLDELQIAPFVWRMPVEIPGAIAFDDDTKDRKYDVEYVQRFWRLLSRISHILSEFRVTFVGKASPVHLFWGALDIATTRFSGRLAPPHTAGAPNCAPHVMLEAYSHEVSSAGYWPGGGKEGAFYSYSYPEPAGYRDAPVGPTGAYYSDELGEFLLPYETIRTSADPGLLLLEFLQTTYEAAANAAHWDRESLERPVPSWTTDGVARAGPLS